ncbi:DUF262 domain-containing protein [Acinetobacter brisouii]|uniref:DUF262 domain-containing protein n=1 Tax=Acinetobacter brisouii TaxID=396323 RepID=UPI0035B2E3E5
MDISPDKQNIDTLFSNTQYNIDFYQRDYKWNAEPVKRLLDDIFYKFNEVYVANSTLPPEPKVIDTKYPWYYLNTYVTNTIDGEVYVVDGQQRLTTITLIIINIYRRLLEKKSKLSKWVDAKICGQVGFENTFWMNHKGHLKTLDALYTGDVDTAPTESGLTALNMVKNYKVISEWLDNYIGDNQNKLETFVFYFLRRLVLINLSVEQTDVPMVFEVINDRGVKLKPYEILKGKLLGQIDKLILESKGYNELWETSLRAVNAFNEDEADRFFRFFLKAKFADTRAEGQKYDGDYHRLMFSSFFEEKLNLNHNPSGVTDFLDNSFKYYSKLYVTLMNKLTTDTNSYFAFNSLNDLEGSLLLGLSVCKINDENQKLKIELIAKELDRFFSLLQLQNSYESNAFQESLYRISSQIRERDADCIRKVFDDEIKAQLSKKRQIETENPFDYSLFKNTGDNLNTRFKRYFFARIEGFLAQNLNVEMRHSYENLVLRTGSVNGFHIEHILSRNAESLAHFNGQEDVFLNERNRLGGILLLKGKDNISSNNETYAEKLKTYSGTLLWNETLREDFYKSNLDFKAFRENNDLAELVNINIFDKDALEVRHKILFKMASIIWS